MPKRPIFAPTTTPLDKDPLLLAALDHLMEDLEGAADPAAIVACFTRFFATLGYPQTSWEKGQANDPLADGGKAVHRSPSSASPVLEVPVSLGRKIQHLRLFVADPWGRAPTLSPCLQGILSLLARRAWPRGQPCAELAPPSPPDRMSIVGEHPLVRTLLAEAARFAQSRVPLLIIGETGTGKELLARWVHEHSRRSRGPWVAVNCSTLKPELAESQLFGHRKGSFTGAISDARGYLREADGGTLFLDEISSLPLEVQPRLLRVLEEGKIAPLGATREQAIDVRVIAAANQDLEELCLQEQFRWDLYYRLCCLRLVLPPLRQRRSDIPRLVEYFLAELERQEGLRVRMDPDALDQLQKYDFPGNVRELRNVVYAAAWSSKTGVIRAADVARHIGGGDRESGNGPGRLESVWNRLTSQDGDFWEVVGKPFLNRELNRDDVTMLIRRGLRETDGNYRKLAALFGIAKDYKRFLAFLAYHRCKPDFRQFRR